MFDRDRQQADLLDQFRQERATDPDLTPPDDLDTGVAAIAVMLEELTPPGPSAHFVQQLDRRLGAEPMPLSNHQPGVLPATSDAELSSPTTPTDWHGASEPRRSRLSEFVRIAAAGLAVMTVGTILVLMFRDADDAVTPGTGGTPSATGEILVSWDPAGGENYKLFIVDAGGEVEPRKLTPGPHEDDGVTERFGSWSPDGQRVAYLRAGNGRSELFVTSADGSQPFNLSEAAGISDVSEFSWSPDGTQIAFKEQGNAGQAAIYTANLDGSNLVEVVRDEEGIANYWPAWSPDGRQIAFIKGEGRAPAEVYVAGTDGSAPQAITDGIGAETLRWSPDGSKIAVTAGRITHSVYVINADGSDQQRLTNPEASVLTPAVWSPDGELLAYAFSDANDLVIDGTVVTRLDGLYRPLIDAVSIPAWSPDGKQIALLTSSITAQDVNTHQAALYVVDEDGSNLQAPLNDVSLAPDPPAWRPVVTEGVLPPAPTPTPAAAVTPTVPDEPAAPTPSTPDEPPAAWLEYGDQSQRGEFSHGCMWPGFDVCVDAGGFFYPDGVMDVPSGVDLTFSVDGMDAADLVNLGARAYPLGYDREMLGERLYVEYSTPFGLSIPTTWSPDRLEITTDLPPGDYAIAVDVSMASDVERPVNGQATTVNGGATYGFHVVVTEDEAPNWDWGTTGTIVGFEPSSELGAIHVVEHPDNPNSGEQFIVTITPETRISERTAGSVEQRTFDDLEVGMRVVVAFTGEVATSYPALALGSDAVIIRTETDGPADPADTVTMTVHHSLFTGYSEGDPIPPGDAFYLAYSVIGGESGELFFCGEGRDGVEKCEGYGATYRAQVEVPRGAELTFTVYRLPGEEPDQTELVESGREILDADMSTRSHYRYHAQGNPGGYD